MRDINRRTALKFLGAAAASGTLASASAAAATPKKGNVRKLGQTILEPSPAADVGPHFAEESIRSDGKYAVVGVFNGEIGSFLVDVSDPQNPTEVHRIDSPSFATRHADVKFDHRDGLYYRTLEGDEGGVQVIDYGFLDASPENPAVVATMDAGETHNLFPHPEEPIVYTVNEHHTDTPGLEVWDVSDPTCPKFHGSFGPDGGLHDIVVDPEREIAHGAYISDAFDEYDPETEFAGYLIWDVSDPWTPREAGRFDYDGRPEYTESRLEDGKPGFERCHYADYDPERGLAIVGDELGTGVPGGKHVFDIGWGDGSACDPKHLGFTYSPNAELMDEPDEVFDWTTHNHDVVPKGNATLLVSGDYHEGAVVYDISDPTDPTPTDTYETDDREDEAGETLGFIGDAPMAWGADYVERRDFAVVSDMVTGLYVFEVTTDDSKSHNHSFIR